MAEFFNPKEFSKDLAKQAEELVPSDLSKEEKEGLVDKLEEFTFIAGDALSKREEPCFDDENCEMVSQIIAEWTFHKYVDLCRAEIPEKYFNPILQKIAFVIFEYSCECVKHGVRQQKMLDSIEKAVKKTYKECLLEIKKKDGSLSAQAQKSLFISNIDKMALEIAEKNEQNKKEEKIRSLAKKIARFEVFILIFSVFFAVYAYKFYPTDYVLLKSYCLFAFVAFCTFIENLASKKNND